MSEAIEAERKITESSKSPNGAASDYPGNIPTVLGPENPLPEAADHLQAVAFPAGPRIKKRIKWVDLPEEYEGFKAEIWVNCPAKYWEDLTKGDELASAAAQKILVSHNGWLDFNGEPYPPSATKDFWETIPTELASVIFSVAKELMAELPNSLAMRGRRSKRS